MATRTDAELREAAATDLGVLGEGATLAAPQNVWLRDRSRDVRGTLVSMKLCWWDADAIPDDVFLGLTWMVAEAAKSKWGRESYDKGPAGLDLIRVAGAERDSGLPTKGTYY